MPCMSSKLTFLCLSLTQAQYLFLFCLLFPITQFSLAAFRITTFFSWVNMSSALVKDVHSHPFWDGFKLLLTLILPGVKHLVILWNEAAGRGACVWYMIFYGRLITGRLWRFTPGTSPTAFSFSQYNGRIPELSWFTLRCHGHQHIQWPYIVAPIPSAYFVLHYARWFQRFCWRIRWLPRLRNNVLYCALDLLLQRTSSPLIKHHIRYIRSGCVSFVNSQGIKCGGH